MPGYNKKGQQNLGLLTGRRLGPCICDSNETKDKQVPGSVMENSRRGAVDTGRCGDRGMGRGLNASAGSGKRR